MQSVFGKLQKVGKALMLPVAVLPVAGLLLRLSDAGLTFIPEILRTYFGLAAGAIFGSAQSGLSLIFAVAIAFGIAKNNHGAAGLAGLIGFQINKAVYTYIAPDMASLGVLDGIIIGLLAGFLYNKYHNIKFPDYLQFFGGKRFIPIITAFATVFTGIAFGYTMPLIHAALTGLSDVMSSTGAFGAFIYGFGNRLLIPFGLHHVLNNVVWFLVGDFTTATGEVIRGDLLRFLQGDPTAGALCSGFYPVIMFGLPGAALAMIKAAKPENRKAITGLMASAGFTAFLTGVTEPIEFAFAFIAFPLFVVHAVIQGVVNAITYMLGIKMAFGFSGGLIDYMIYYKQATVIGGNPLMLIPIGIATAALYYVLFTFAINKWNIMTPGREDMNDEDLVDGSAGNVSVAAVRYFELLGGIENIIEVDSCITRLRLRVKDNTNIDEASLKAVGAAGVLKQSKANIQVVVGTKAELIAEELKSILNDEMRKLS